MTTDPEGLALLLAIALLGLVFLCVAAVVEHVAIGRRRRRFTRIDFRRCERAGSQSEFVRRLRAGGGL